MKQGVPQASLRASEAAKRLEPRGHGAKRSPQGRNTAQALAQGGAKVWDDHAELRNSAKRSAAPECRASEAQAGTKTPMKQGASQERFANGGGPKGWSGERTERSTVRSHGTPRKRSAVRCERSEATMLN